MNRYTYHLLTAEAAARLYGAAMQMADSMGQLASLRTLVVAHEALVVDFDREMGKICGFLGLTWSDALKSFADRVRSRGVATPSASQLALGLNSDGVGQWRRYARQLEPLAALLQPWVERFGYERSIASGWGAPASWTRSFAPQPGWGEQDSGPIDEPMAARSPSRTFATLELWS